MMNRSNLGLPGDSCSMEFRVRYAECDAMGYLHHAKYWEYFEHARMEMLRKNGFRYRDLEKEGVFFVVYKASCKYLAPIRYDDRVTVTTTVTRISRIRVEHVYVITQQGDRKCEASTTLACVDHRGRPRLMPDSLWSGLAGDSS